MTAFVIPAVAVFGVVIGRTVWQPSAEPEPVAKAAPAPSGPACAEGETPIGHRFASGGEWRMCWRIDPHSGLVLSRIGFQAPGRAELPVAKEMTIAQLEVPYDTGKETTRDITEAGFGGRSMITLTPTSCSGQRISATIPDFGTGAVGGAETREVLCSEALDTGLGRRSGYGGGIAESRGETFQLSTLSVVGWYEYLTVYGFADDGTITPRLGATGDLSPKDFSDDPKWGSPVGHGKSDGAVSHSHNAVWRIRWELGPSQSVEEYNAKFTGKEGPKAPVLTGAWTPIAREATRRLTPRRFWRVVSPVLNPDGHRVSYAIDNGETSTYDPKRPAARTHHHAGAGYDIAFSQYNPCERFATDNLMAGCPTDTTSEFTADRQPLSDVVSWVSVSFHHVPRDEDQSPMEIHWQGFSATPFNSFPQNPLTPPERAHVNGRAAGQAG
ncbi:copper amine oxidase [Actinocorallia lasiicapitis]